MPGFDVSLTLDQINALIKSAGISLDVSVKKLADMRPGRARDNEQLNYSALVEAVDALRDIQMEALTS